MGATGAAGFAVVEIDVLEGLLLTTAVLAIEIAGLSAGCTCVGADAGGS